MMLVRPPLSARPSGVATVLDSLGGISNILLWILVIILYLLLIYKYFPTAMSQHFEKRQHQTEAFVDQIVTSESEQFEMTPFVNTIEESLSTALLSQIYPNLPPSAPSMSTFTGPPITLPNTTLKSSHRKMRPQYQNSTSYINEIKETK